MPSPGNLTIINGMSGVNLQITCDVNNWNCCDHPQPGEIIGSLTPFTSLAYTCYRKGGHGCDGNQGIWTFDILANSIALGSQPFQIDGDGGIAFNGDNTPGFSSYLASGDNGVIWIILPTVS